jgi:hypothetical protein
MNKRDDCGVEVSAKRLLAGLEREGAPRARREFPNTPEGHEALVRWLAAPGRTVRVVMEATGLYGLDLALRLDPAPSVEVMVANPRAVRHFAIALMKRSKNDPIDTDTCSSSSPSACPFSVGSVLRQRRWPCTPWRGAWSPSPRCTPPRRTVCTPRSSPRLCQRPWCAI